MRTVGARLCLFLALICLLSPGLSATGFPKMPQYKIGDRGLTTTGDLNGDGRVDLVVLSQCSPTSCSNGTIAVSLGWGNGKFRPPVISTIEAFPPYTFLPGSGPAIGDFNGDHKSDIAFVSVFSGSQYAIAVLLSNGDGTFGPTTSYPVAWTAYTIAQGDVNGDTKLDLVVMKPGYLQVFLGNGDGTFRTLSDVYGAPVPACVLADVNHDGKLDLIGGYIQLGNGDGSFQDAQPISKSYCPAVADLDADGNLDVAASSQSRFNLYFGNGDGTFQPPVYRWTSLMDDEPRVGDFNGDGKPDLLTTRGSEVDIFLNAGNTWFKPPLGYMSLEYMALSSPVLADLNGDRKTDIIFLRRASDKIFAVPALAGPDGTFSLPRSFYLPGGSGPTGIMAGDLDGDGKLDLVELNSESLTWTGGHLNRLLGNGDGTFKAAKDLLTGGRSSYFGRLSDLNGDGKLDVVVASGDSINIRLGSGDGNFQNPLNYPIEGSWGIVVAVADFNGDGIPDVAATNKVGPGMILLGNGDGTLRACASLPASLEAVVAGDFNLDGKQDLAVATSTYVGIMLGKGDGSFSPISALRKGYTRSLLAADFNLDGKLDLAAVGRSAAENTIASVYLGNGDGTLQLTRNIWVKGGTSPGGAVAADFNADGKPDLAVGLGSAEVAVLTGNGIGGFQPATFSFGGSQLIAGDFDRNGTQDLAVITSVLTGAVLLNK